jgi:hypothetical protein
VTTTPGSPRQLDAYAAEAVEPGLVWAYESHCRAAYARKYKAAIDDFEFAGVATKPVDYVQSP